MKKTAVFFLIVLAVFLTSCARPAPETTVTEYKPKTETKKASTETTSDVKVIASQTIAPPKKTKPTEKKEKKKKTKPTTMPPTQGKTKPNTRVVVTTVKGSFSSEDLTFVYDGETINLNEKIDDVFESIGEDNSASTLSNNRQEYEYEDFTIVTYIKNDVERVESITVTGEKVATAKGAKIGMFASRLKRVYGDAKKVTKTAYIYGSGAKTLEFNYEDNIVTGWTYKYKH